MSAAFPAVRFDGRRATAVPVTLHVYTRWLVVEAPDGTILDRERLDRAAISEPFERAPRMVRLPSGPSLEVPDADGGFAKALGAAGLSPSPAVRLQQWWAGAVAALVALGLALAAGYVWGLPAAARWGAFHVPPRLEARMGQQVLAVLDRYHLQPSRLDVRQRARIAERFARAAEVTAPGVPYRLVFRSTRANGVNAMALPGGIVVLLDGLVHFAGEEDAVLGVLGHELGHIVHKHTTRQIIQSGGVGVLASLLWGDFSGVAASVPAALSALHYSRDFEREADGFALAFLESQGLSAKPLYGFFLRLRGLEERLGISGIPPFMSTHPSTDERLERFRGKMPDPGAACEAPEPREPQKIGLLRGPY